MRTRRLPKPIHREPILIPRGVFSRERRRRPTFAKRSSIYIFVATDFAYYEGRSRVTINLNRYPKMFRNVPRSGRTVFNGQIPGVSKRLRIRDRRPKRFSIDQSRPIKRKSITSRKRAEPGRQWEIVRTVRRRDTDYGIDTQ